MNRNLLLKWIQSNLSYVTFQGYSEIGSHKTGGCLIQVNKYCIIVVQNLLSIKSIALNSPSVKIKKNIVQKLCIIFMIQWNLSKLNLLGTSFCVRNRQVRGHQSRQSGWNSRPISAEVALPRLQSEIKVALSLFASHSFLANYLHFMVKLIDKAIVINVKIHKNERKGFYSSNKEGLICWYKSWKESWQTSVNLYVDEIPGENLILNLKIYKQTLPVPNWPLNCVVF